MALIRKDVHGSLSLQALLYYNMFYAMFFFPMSLFFFMHKTSTYDVKGIFKILPAILGGLFLVAEVARLRLGYVGNLREKIPELSAFLLLTCFPVLPIAAFLGFVQVPMHPREAIIGGPILFFMVAEIVVSYRTVRQLIQKQTADFFRLCQEDPSAASGGVQ